MQYTCDRLRSASGLNSTSTDVVISNHSPISGYSKITSFPNSQIYLLVRVRTYINFSMLYLLFLIIWFSNFLTWRRCHVMHTKLDINTLPCAPFYPQINLCFAVKSLDWITASYDLCNIHVIDSDQHPDSISKFSIWHIILKSMSFPNFSSRRPILKSMTNSHFLKLMSYNVTDVYPNPNQEIGHWSENFERMPIWESH
jgi:hypothetical protein